MSEQAEILNSKSLSDRTSIGIGFGLFMHAALFCIHIATASTAESDVGNIFKDSYGYDKNAIFFDPLGAVLSLFERVFG